MLAFGLGFRSQKVKTLQALKGNHESGVPFEEVDGFRGGFGGLRGEYRICGTTSAHALAQPDRFQIGRSQP